jgi:hypothetical protein
MHELYLLLLRAQQARDSVQRTPQDRRLQALLIQAGSGCRLQQARLGLGAGLRTNTQSFVLPGASAIMHRVLEDQ